MKNYTEDNYQRCQECGKYADDGGLREEQFVCFDCLEK